MKNTQQFRQQSALFTLEGVNSIWATVLDRSTHISFPKNHEIQTIQSDYFYYLIKGKLKLSCLSANGQERVVMHLGPGTLFNEVSHLHLSAHRHSLHTLEQCEVGRFPDKLLKDTDFFTSHPLLIQNLVQSLGIKTGAFFAQLFDSGLIHVRGRVCRMLHQLWKENGEKPSFRTNVSQVDMAAMLGVHRSSLCREIRTLREQGIIGHFSKAKLEIYHPEKLLENLD